MKAVNLLPSEQRGSAKTAAVSAKPDRGPAPFGAYVILGALAFAVVATALSVLASNTVKERRSELARVTAEAQAVQRQAATLQSYADFQTVAQQRVTTVTGLAGSRFDWARTLDDLSRALPADVHLRQLNGSTGTEGETSAIPSMQLVGCTRTQLSLARLMSRLRNVRGVTGVSLSKSAATATEESADSAPSTEGSLCPKGAPPEFDLTMSFERAAVSAGAAVNPSAADATTATATDASGTAPAATATPTSTTSSTGASE